ncbi:proline--tRNA ligase [Actinomycetaceae bacterium WB03_NA08]|uniref:Proline--tRNA ligase n=1 Tax=Scrofimicrobium canadense TaxID=2652290 RepID=A0A6N7W8E1_9ACTO|nr:proline--tRNA ligase [Scrofimicrobium canadense]MSS84702.1 proline--tRNA ligase [Scrofimicrobium canadense]
MITTMSNLFLRTLREDPAEAELDSHKLLVRAGYIRRAAPGVYTWLPLGLRVLRKIETIVREEMERAGAQEVLFPALLPADAYKATGRWEEYGPLLFRLKDRRGGDYLLAPTHEEQFTLLVKSMFSSYKDLPLTIYQIQTKYRDEARPRGGLLRGREFIMKDAYSFDLDADELESSYQAQRKAYQAIFDRLGLEYVICSAMAGAMGGSKSEEFLHPSGVGEDTYVVSPGGYVANTEAVTTVVPNPLPMEGLPPAQVFPTPNTPTIDSLVAVANAEHPRSDREWTAADTLKNVVFAVTSPEGERTLVVVGLPGDREVDVKRLEAALAPAEVEVATEEDFEKHPELVQGYIGPEVLSPNGGEVRYLLDPRVVDGTAWITGANKKDHHVFGLVKGRDFQADGTIEAAEVRAGDPAPDGSGALEIHRGIEIGHIFQLGQKYAKALDLKVLDQNGKTQTVTMGSYGIGVSRVLAAMAESFRDESGLAWPSVVAPFDVQVVVAGKGEELDTVALDLATQCEAAGMDVLLDERRGVSAGVKFADAELLGVPLILVVGRGLKDGVVELRERRTGVRDNIPVAEALEEVWKRHGLLVEEGR